MASARRIGTRSSVGGGGVHRRRQGYADHWQNACIELLRHVRLGRISGPTGSGKSAVETALLSFHRGKSLLISPESVILEGIKPLDFLLHSGERVQWAPALVLADTTDCTEKALAWLENPGHGTALLTCATMIRLYDTLRNAGRLDRLHAVAKSFDEAHHSDSGIDSRNRIAEIIEHSVRCGTAPTYAATATWLRTNLNEILPNNGADFTEYIYPTHEYLANMTYLREVLVGYLIGTPEAAFQELLNEGNLRTLVHIPQPDSRHWEGDKQEQLAQLLRLCGPFTESADSPFRNHRRRIGRRTVHLTTSDLITVDGRDGPEGRKRRHMESLRANILPDIIFALRLALEGYDDPSLQRGLLIGARNSPITKLQALGRLLRDILGKRWVSFYMTIPPLVDPDQARNFLTEIISNLADLDWRIRPSAVDYDVRPEEERVVRPGGRPRVNEDDFDMARASRELLNEALRNPNISTEDLNRIARDVVRDQGVTNEAVYAAELLHRQERIFRSVSARDLPQVELAGDYLGMLPRVVTHVTAESIRRLRMTNGYDLGITLQEIRDAVRLYHERTGQWPHARTSGEVPGLEGITWHQAHGAASQQRSSLDEIVDSERERRTDRRRSRSH